MAHFIKLWSYILDSTIWREANHVRLLWITMLAMADKNGKVDGSIPGLAIRANITLPECEEALDKLYAPDKYSRSQEHDGRRIEKVEGGWLILNYIRMRDLASKQEHVAAQNRYTERKGLTKGGRKPPLVYIEQGEDVEKLDQLLARATDESPPVAICKPAKPARPKNAPLSFCFPPELNTVEFQAAFWRYVKHREEIKKKITQTNGEAILYTLAAMGQQRAIAAINHTITMGWQGLREPDLDQNSQNLNAGPLFGNLPEVSKPFETDSQRRTRMLLENRE